MSAIERSSCSGLSRSFRSPTYPSSFLPSSAVGTISNTIRRMSGVSAFSSTSMIASRRSFPSMSLRTRCCSIPTCCDRFCSKSVTTFSFGTAPPSAPVIDAFRFFSGGFANRSSSSRTSSWRAAPFPRSADRLALAPPAAHSVFCARAATILSQLSVFIGFDRFSPHVLAASVTLGEPGAGGEHVG